MRKAPAPEARAFAFLDDDECAEPDEVDRLWRLAAWTAPSRGAVH